MEHYELNPIWQKSISQRKWFNLRHTLLVMAVTVVLVGVLVVSGMLLGRHISNLLLFRYLARRPDQISGEVTISHQLVLAISMYQTMLVIIPMALIAIFSHNNFARGGLLGAALLFCVHLVWMYKAKKRKTSAKEPATQSAAIGGHRRRHVIVAVNFQSKMVFGGDESHSTF